MTSSSLGLSCRIHSKGKSDDHYSQRRYDKPGKVPGFRALMPRSLSSKRNCDGGGGRRRHQARCPARDGAKPLTSRANQVRRHSFAYMCRPLKLSMLGHRSARGYAESSRMKCGCIVQPMTLSTPQKCEPLNIGESERGFGRLTRHLNVPTLVRSPYSICRAVRQLTPPRSRARHHGPRDNAHVT